MSPEEQTLKKASKNIAIRSDYQGFHMPVFDLNINPQFRVNTTTSGNQNNPSIAALANGGFIVVWESFGIDGDGYGIAGQHFGANGDRIGSEFLVNETTALYQRRPSVTGLDDGGFVVSWESNLQDGSGSGVAARIFNADGTVRVSEFQVNSFTSGHQLLTELTTLSDGSFVVIWHSFDQDGDNWGVYGQRYNAQGIVQSGEFKFNTSTVSTQVRATISALQNGGFVATWESLQDGVSWDVYGQVFNATGGLVGTEFRVNTYTANEQYFSSVTAFDDGGFLVTWQSEGQDGNFGGIYGQRYSADGQASGTEFLINSTTFGAQREPSVTTLSDGGFVVVWISFHVAGTSEDLFAQRFDAQGNPVGTEFLVTTPESVSGSEYQHQVVALPNGGYAVTWAASGAAFSGGGIHTRIFYTESFYGTEANDIIYGRSISETLSGNAGDDIFIGSLGNDKLFGGTGSDTANYSDDTLGITVTGTLATGTGIGTDTLSKIPNIIGGSGNDTITGGGSKNALFGNAGDDIIFGVKGNDKLFGGSGNDTLNGGTGNDRLFGGSGKDIARAGSGADTVAGGGGNDRIFGQGGNDLLQGGGGRDKIIGGGGKDKIEGGAGNDVLIGGKGADLFVFDGTVNEGSDRIKDFADGIDLLQVSGANFSQMSIASINAGADTQITMSSGTVVTLTGVDSGLIDATDFDFI